MDYGNRWYEDDYYYSRKRQHRTLGYARRDANLKSIRWEDYDEYTSSHGWAWIRYFAFKLHGKYCLCCGNRATQIHHCNYDEDVLRGDNLKPLKPVCRRCHEAAEINEYGEKASLTEANNFLGFNRNGGCLRRWKYPFKE